MFIFKKKYDFVFSVGSSCYTACVLQQHNLRYASMPFDWLNAVRDKGDNEVFCDKINFILNDFKYFFDSPNDFIKAEWDNSTLVHIPVVNKKTGLQFLHDFPRDKSIEEMFFQVKEKYYRRIERFYFKLNQAKKILMVFMQDGWFRERNMKYLTDDVIFKSINQLCNSYPDKKWDILIVEDTIASNDSAHQKAKLYKTIRKRGGGV